MRLAEDRFYNKYPSILVTGKGQPDVGTRLFLRRLWADLKIPVLALVDADPFGLKARPAAHGATSASHTCCRSCLST